MNRRFLLALAGAALCGLLAILITQRILINKAGQATKDSYTSILMAKVRIPANTTITAEMVKAAPYFKADLPEGSQAEPKQVIGKTSTIDIEANIPITTRNTVASNLSLLSNVIAREKRAISIRIDEASGVAGFATPGNFVDVIAVMNPGSGSRTISKTIVQNLRVIAYGQSTQPRTEGNNRAGNTVTLEASPAQAEALTLAMREGTLHLVLRNPGDQELHVTNGVQSANLVDEIPVNSGTAAQRPMPRGARDLPPPIGKPQTRIGEPTAPARDGADAVDSKLTEYKVFEGITEKKVLVKR